MVRLTDLTPRMQDALKNNIPIPSFERKPFFQGPPLSARRVAVVTSSGLSRRGVALSHFHVCHLAPENPPPLLTVRKYCRDHVSSPSFFEVKERKSVANRAI